MSRPDSMPPSEGPVELWRARLLRVFDSAEVRVSDESHRHAGHLPSGSPARGTHASVQIISERFEGLSPVERHRMIYAALELGAGDADLHALQVRAWTPAEARKSRSAAQNGQSISDRIS